MIRRIGFSIEIAFVLFLISAATGAFWVPMKHLQLPMFLVLISLPAIASLSFVLAAALTRLVSAGRMAFPLNLTIPLVHVVLLLLVVKLALTTPIAVERIRSEWEIATVWGSWRLLLTCFLVEVTALSLMLAFSQRKRRVGTI